MLLYILSKPDDWEIYLDELIASSPNTKAATERAFKELVKAGHIYQTRRSLGYKKFKWFKFASDKKMNPQIKDAFEKRTDEEMASLEKII
ncbi:transcriptional regulator [Streptococcus cristatus]|uniref:transcriptional regulator n=1 Tax=Streptococcus cristatus TaxID=45634 RepID=UPI0028D79278|nr:transcriptional regulator [Streptococcus cristatus]